MTFSTAKGITAMNVEDLLARYQQEREICEARSQQLARLRGDVLVAADDQAKQILHTARADIRRILMDARRDLRALTYQLQGLEAAAQSVVDHGPKTAAEPVVIDASPEVAPVTAARRDLGHAVREVRPELDALTRDVTAWRVSDPTTPEARERVAFHVSTSSAAVMADASSSVHERPFTLSIEDSGKRRSYAGLLILAFTLSAAAITAILVSLWWRHPAAASLRAVPSLADRTSSIPADAKPIPHDRIAVPSRTAPPKTTSTAALVLTVRRPTWIRVTVDGRTDIGRVYQPGETLQIDRSTDTTLRVGDAGAISVTAETGSEHPLGPNGAVVTRRFAPNAVSTSNNVHSPAAPAVEASRPAAALPTTAERGDSVAMADEPPADLRASAEAWLDAYYRGDVVAMQRAGGGDAAVKDERRPGERPASGVDNMHRSFESMSARSTPAATVLTARMSEAIPGVPNAFTSWVSLLWVRQGDAWRLTEARLISNGRLESSGKALQASR